jgi:hypothetical protein
VSAMQTVPNGTSAIGHRNAAGRIELWALSDTEWRISNKDVPMGDAGSLLGFAEKSGDRYEVLQLSGARVQHGPNRLTFASLGDVVAYFDHES